MVRNKSENVVNALDDVLDRGKRRNLESSLSLWVLTVTGCPRKIDTIRIGRFYIRGRTKANKTENYSVSMPSPRYFSTNWEVNRGNFDHKYIQNIKQYSKVLNSTHKFSKVLKSTKKYSKVPKSTKKSTKVPKNA